MRENKIDGKKLSIRKVRGRSLPGIYYGGKRVGFVAEGGLYFKKSEMDAKIFRGDTHVAVHLKSGEGA